MQSASFSIINYQFDEVYINLHNYKKEDDLGILFQPKGVFQKDRKVFGLIFSVSLQHKNTEPFVHINCKGLFEFKNVETIEDIPDFFYKNSIPILFPYVRAYISLVTTQANVPGIILPIYNLSGLEEELRNNTTEA